MSATAHATFTIDRELDAPVELVFRAFADPKHKARWFKGPPQWRQDIREHDFRVGGNDRLKGEWGGAGHPWKVSDFKAQYYDIVENRRIVYVYEMTIDGVRISVSLATIEFESKGGRTKLRVTKQGAFLDGYDDAGRRREGVSAHMDMLAETLRD